MRSARTGWVAGVVAILFIIASAGTAHAQGNMEVKESYINVHDALGEVGIRTPMRWGNRNWGYRHIQIRAQQDPATHVDEPVLSLVIQTVLGSEASRVINTDDGYNVIGPGIDGNIWTVVVSETAVSDSYAILGIITAFKVRACRTAFVIDTTGSMADDIAAVKTAANQILDSLEASCGGYQAAVVAYNDPSAQLVLGFSSDRTAITNAINSLGASGGGDWPEHVYSGLMTAIGLPWPADTNNDIILLGDAPAKNPEPGTGYTQASVIAAANAAGVSALTYEAGGFSEASVSGEETGGLEMSDLATTAGGVAIHPVLVGFDLDAEASFQPLADGTGGTLVRAASASQVATAILQAIGNSGAQPRLKVQYRPEDNATGDSEIKPYFKIVNTGDGGVSLSELAIRYWFTAEPGGPFVFNCSYATRDCANVRGSVVWLSPARTGANAYLEVKLTSEAGILLGGEDSGEIKVRVHDTLWQPFNETGDYSLDLTKLSGYADWSKVTLYRNGQLVWGQEP